MYMIHIISLQNYHDHDITLMSLI